jgi:hypothetical protein
MLSWNTNAIIVSVSRFALFCFLAVVFGGLLVLCFSLRISSIRVTIPHDVFHQHVNRDSGVMGFFFSENRKSSVKDVQEYPMNNVDSKD